eukprot:gnl/TRDRNA2_/TRDRNA2_194042_c0_seq1.p2 gnl/TRDRNA2_/TRDRNA2_194042_c0~~gnl/TRDRNA2_/TRDRNA2_194042_c0_seq1.p2  ORF type:complete len:231 (-),score=80.48 gnl/TRDRNA2_/TRDRNA2_194042_c0_seq1:47-739(-)
MVKVKKKAPLAGKVQGLLPPALDLSQLPRKASKKVEEPEDDDDDGPPEEVTNLPAGEDDDDVLQAAAEEADNAVAAKEAETAASSSTKGKSSRRRKHEEELTDEKPTDPKYFWQDADNRKLLAQLQEKDAKRREKRQKGGVVEKDGIVLVHASDAGVCADDRGRKQASQFLIDELFGARKRQRSATDRYDRNVLNTRKGLNAHMARPVAKPAVRPPLPRRPKKDPKQFEW